MNVNLLRSDEGNDEENIFGFTCVSVVIMTSKKVSDKVVSLYRGVGALEY